MTVVRETSRFLALILLSAFQAFLSGLRWGYDIVDVMYVALWAPLLFPLLSIVVSCDLSIKTIAPLIGRLSCTPFRRLPSSLC